jgi:hypothetical protein
MTMSGTVRALLSFLVAIVALYILEITEGAAMDSLYLQFYNITPTLPMSLGWQAIAIGTLGGWVWYYRSFLIVLIAIGVWVISTIIVDIDYARQLR